MPENGGASFIFDGRYAHIILTSFTKSGERKDERKFCQTFAATSRLEKEYGYTFGLALNAAYHSLSFIKRGIDPSLKMIKFSQVVVLRSLRLACRHTVVIYDL